MKNRIITDISDYIFVSDEPKEADAIFLPGSSHPEQPEYAAELYHIGMAKWLIPSGGINITKENWHQTEYGTDRVLGELARCGNQFVSDIKHYLAFM